MAYLKSKFYPVDVTQRIIYDDPQPREADCSLGSPVYQHRQTIGIKGERLNRFECYRLHEVRKRPA